MAQPNLINASSCFFTFSKEGSVATAPSSSTIISSTPTDKMRRVVSLYACNTSSGTLTFTCYLWNVGNYSATYICKDVPVPSNATLVVITKDAPLHMHEGSETIRVAGSGSGFDCVVSYEEYDDA